MYAHVCLPGYFLFSREQAPSNRDESQRCRRHDGSVDQARHGEVRRCKMLNVVANVSARF